jgi:hypothetical protein
MFTWDFCGNFFVPLLLDQKMEQKSRLTNPSALRRENLHEGLTPVRAGVVNIFETFSKCLPPRETGCHVVETQCFASILRIVVTTIRRNVEPEI